MTEKDRRLLLIDLCARLPHGVKMTDGVDTYRLTSPFLYKYIEMELKPYLRPMSSMTEKEVKEFAALESTDVLGGNIKITSVELSINAIDWLNKNHFDYRGLIPMGLAIEAPVGMYKIK